MLNYFCFQAGFSTPVSCADDGTSCDMTVNMEGCEIDFKIILLDFGYFQDNGYICRVPEGVGQI